MTEPFDVCGPLPQGTVVLEASAGTGKTTTIASLTARYVAEGVARLPELMLVTFGRLATSELRERVRERLVVVEAALRNGTPSTDPVIALLASTDRAVRAQRLAVALAEFDAATITTTHGFCQQMLTSLGTLGDVEPDARLVPDIASLEAEVVDDLYLRKYASTDSPTLSVPDARRVAHEAISDAAALLEPENATSERARDSYGLAAAARRELLRRKRALRVLDYDDLLVLLRDALTDPETGQAAAERVRSRYRIVMVDEFQDTDPVQWDILRTAFHGHRTLVLIGDPKQAVYRFRGADVATYLRARAVASTQTLHRNWRADPAVLDGLAPILSGTALGDPRIVVHPIEPARTGSRLRGGPAVRLRQVTRTALGVPDGAANPPVGKVRDFVYADVAAQVLRTLSEEQIADEDGGWRSVQPGDIAVLTRVNRDAVAVQRSLVSVGVPAVISMLSSVFGTPSARDWLILLSALARPGVSGFVSAAALTPFVGWTANELAEASDERRDELADLLRTWSRVLDDHGVASLLEATAAAGLRERLVRLPDGERRLTDVRHVGEALHAAATDDGLGAAALLEWLRARVEEAGQDYAEERSRRLETDTAAVQVITVHASKGLQFPVVLVPFLWDKYSPPSPATIGYDRDDVRLLHVGGKGSPGYDEARAAGAAADDGEGLRLAYVALTRATSQVVAWWAPSANSVRGALTRLLLGARDSAGNPAELVKTTTDAATTQVLRALTNDALELEVVTSASVLAPWAPPTAPATDLQAATLDRRPDVAWRRTSYSALTAAAHETGRVGSEPEVPGVQDEPDGATGPPAAVEPADGLGRDVSSPMADLPSGTAFGTFAHRVLELLDTSAPDLGAELAARCAEAGALLTTDPATTADALLPSLHTPLGPLAGDLSLAAITPRDRLAELDFELPLAGGDAGSRRTARTIRDVAGLLRAHLPADDPFTPYADHLDELSAAQLRGYLTGSIDAVLRVPADVPGGHRYLVVDYKTNRLGTFDEPLTLWHYRPASTLAAMIDAHYPLQLLLYSAALHRYLRWRLPGYDPGSHLGGGLYLFLRGMAGPSTPTVDGVPFGVVSWRPPAALVVALSDLLAGS
ncbi:UvrD-helicase domain-containing protein [Cellulomonas xylanilytica]|uniref:RecBCD enzyme subunit RecB n=1 Tax=Cellulomonas xylanilytica TaxID=233583 RepID=A0A510V8V3_9CELL|nr:UvrD-helicase domain-containing protein [Cellulomonas xylanilytica]GEK23298.1 RecBCD enzyme subunit RecB [Cellulomonas xylanilytica]